MIKVSVIITVYNVERYIVRCVDSILSQTYTNFELLIVNDGTPDKSIDIAKKTAGGDKRVRILDYVDNVGLMNARRRGYLEAKGDYVMFVDSDDTIPLDAIEKLVKAAERNNADIVAGKGMYYLSNGRKKEIPISIPYGSDSQGLYKALTHYYFPHYIWGKLIKRELLQNYEYKYFNKLTNAEDYCLMYQLAGNVRKIICIEEIVYNYYQNPESSSQVRLSHWQLECNIMVYSFILNLLSKNPFIKSDIYSSTQRTVSRFYSQGYNDDLYLDALMKKYFIQDLLSFTNVIKHNSIKNSLLFLVGKTKLGSVLYKLTHK